MEWRIWRSAWRRDGDQFHPGFRAQARRRFIVRSGLLLVGVPAVMALWLTFAPERRLQQLDTELAALDAQIATMSASMEEETVVVTDQMSFCERLQSPVPCASIAAVIADVMPPSVGLTRFGLTGVPVQPVPIKAQNQAGGKTAEAGPRKRAISLVLEGVAPDGVPVARFLGGLDEHPIFEHVELGYSRPVEGDALHGCEFQITAEIPIDRTYMARQQTEVADAN
jgi:Tfp pilus assembly protein PilN